MPTKDYYGVLGVKPDASAQEIKKSYWELALKYHPDRNGADPKNEERLKEITQAYYVVGNEERRRKYDFLSKGSFEDRLFQQSVTEDDLINFLWRLYREGSGVGWGGCRGTGLGMRGCGRWKR